MIRNWIVLGAIALFAQGASLPGQRPRDTQKSNRYQRQALFSGWHCDAEKIEIEFSNDKAEQHPAAYGHPAPTRLEL